SFYAKFGNKHKHRCIIPLLQQLQTHLQQKRIMRSLYRVPLVIIVLFVANLCAQSPESRGITAEDYYSFEFLTDPHISPDGKFVAYVVAKVDRAQNRRLSSIWMVSTDGSRAPWQFTTSPQSSTSPRWSPDGKWLAFL